MTFGVTPEGFKPKKFVDIIDELGTELKTRLGIDIDADPDSIAKVITNTYGLALAEEWALPQALQSMFDIDKAEGKHLDDLVGYVGMRRLSAAATSGKEYITTDKELVVPAGSEFIDINSNTYNNPTSITIQKSNYVELELKISATTPIGETLTITTKGSTSSLTYAQNESSITGLVNDINAKTNTNGITAVSTSSGGDFSLKLTANTDLINSSSATSNNFDVLEVTAVGTINRDVVGGFFVGALTVTTPPPLSGILSVTNRYDLVTGREAESDIDLRNRHSLSLATAGAATVEAIRADLLDVANVSSVSVTENDSLITTVEGLPAKSFRCIIEGGTDQDIGDALWLTKGAGIETYGSTTVIVLDGQGGNQAVKFSRPTSKWIHMHVTYSLYSEESGAFPVDGEDQMTFQILSYGNTLTVGEDVIPQRFATQIFNTVGGLATVNIEVGETDSVVDPTPILSPLVLPISASERSAYDGTIITYTGV